MTTLTLELPPQIDQQLRERAERLGKSPQAIVREWLIEPLAKAGGTPLSEIILEQRGPKG